MVNKDEYIMH